VDHFFESANSLLAHVTFYLLALIAASRLVLEEVNTARRRWMRRKSDGEPD
jgi:hypothetical protein